MSYIVLENRFVYSDQCNCFIQNKLLLFHSPKDVDPLYMVRNSSMAFPMDGYYGALNHHDYISMVPSD